MSNTATDMQSALNELCTSVHRAVQKYLDETDHTNRPEIQLKYLDVSNIGEPRYQPLVAAYGQLMAET